MTTKDTDNVLRGIQEEHWKNYQQVDREWPTPPLEGTVRDALAPAEVPNSVLAVGIGGLARDALLYAEIPGTQVVGIDINEEAVKMASALPRKDTVSFLSGNILEPTIVDRLGAERFGAVTMVGLLTNLVTDHDAQLALDRTYQLLAPGGSVVVSDYALGEGSEYWVGRYERDAAVLETLGYGGRNENFGTLIIRPGKLNPDDMGYVSAEDQLDLHRTVNLMREGKFERMVRHRNRETFSDLLMESGFGIPVETKQKTLVTPRPGGGTTPWDFSNNMQIRAIKPIRNRK